MTASLVNKSAVAARAARRQTRTRKGELELEGRTLFARLSKGIFGRTPFSLHSAVGLSASTRRSSSSSPSLRGRRRRRRRPPDMMMRYARRNHQKIIP